MGANADKTGILRVPRGQCSTAGRAVFSLARFASDGRISWNSDVHVESERGQSSVEWRERYR